jgi:hypothetical protein
MAALLSRPVCNKNDLKSVCEGGRGGVCVGGESEREWYTV